MLNRESNPGPFPLATDWLVAAGRGVGRRIVGLVVSVIVDT